MKHRLTIPVIWIMLCVMLGLIYPSSAWAESPKIEIWYGHHQVFGRPTISQRWVNILGNVSNSNQLVSLTYSINGGHEHPLSVGPDKRRLASTGDFNIDILYADLQLGLNQVKITATNNENQQITEIVTIEYIPTKIDTQPYVVDWSKAAMPQESAQIVDGHWFLEAAGIRPVEIGYDRVIAIGDMWWDDYEVTVPIIIHGAEPKFSYPSHGASVFVVARWQGHRVWDGAQPAYGWWPLGGTGTVKWVTPSKTEVVLAGNKVLPMATGNVDRYIKFDVPYQFKLRVETLPGYASLYSFKLWEADKPEPVTWDFKGQQRLWNPLFGSVLLVAHHVDATFGLVTVTPLARSPWEWFSLLGSYVAQIPIIFVCLAGMIISVKFWKTFPRAARLTMFAAILLAISTLAGTFLDIQLPVWLHRQGWSTHEIGVTLVVYETLKALLIAFALGSLIFAVFPLFRKNYSTKPDASQSNLPKL